MLTTNQKGILAEAAITYACVRLGVCVARPLDDERYDLILDLRPALLRVQCKYARCADQIVRARLYTTRRNNDGILTRRYSPGEFDAFALYCPDLDACYLLPSEDVVAMREVYLRVAPTKNNQAARIRWARCYELEATIRRLQGPIAQLGERRAGSAKVAGSSPAGSIATARR